MSSRGRAVRVDGPSSRKRNSTSCTTNLLRERISAGASARECRSAASPKLLQANRSPLPCAVEPPNINQSALWTALVSRHTPPVVAKRVIDFIARGGYAHVLVPVVEDERALNADIAAHGVRVKQVSRTSLYKKPNQASRPIGCSTAKTPSDTR